MPVQNSQDLLDLEPRKRIDPSVSRRRNALIAFFLIPGIVLASWVTRTPAIRDAIHASIAEMGLVLLGLSFGSLAGVLGAGRIVSRIGTKATALIGLGLTVASLLTITIGVLSNSALVVTIGLTLFGLGMGMCEIAINIDGAEVERQMGRSVMHVLHGSYSLGTLCGALIGLAFNALDVPVSTHLTAVGVLVIPAILYFARYLPSGFGKLSTAAARHDSVPLTNSQNGRKVWCDPVLLLIGFIAFGMALAEGTANDWLPIFMVDEHRMSESFGALTFVIFAVCMTLGRLCGGALVDRLGRTAALRISAFLAAAGIALAAFGSGQLLAAVAVLLWGIGTSLAFPLAISAAGQSGPNTAMRVQIVAVIGYIALLVGPPALGFVGEHASLRIALVIVLCIVVMVVLAGSAVSERRAAGDTHTGGRQDSKISTNNTSTQ